MGETKFGWDDLRLFLAVARGGGLAAAASETRLIWRWQGMPARYCQPSSGPALTP